jgi:hypothetical protein
LPPNVQSSVTTKIASQFFREINALSILDLIFGQGLVWHIDQQFAAGAVCSLRSEEEAKVWSAGHDGRVTAALALEFKACSHGISPFLVGLKHLSPSPHHRRGADSMRPVAGI